MTSSEQEQAVKMKGNQDDTAQQIPRPTVVAERSKSLIGSGVDRARSGAQAEQVGGVPVTTISMGQQQDRRDSSSSNLKAGRKFQPASQRSKSFIKTSGLAYGANVSGQNDSQKSRSPFRSKLAKAEPQSAVKMMVQKNNYMVGLQNQYKTQ